MIKKEGVVETFEIDNSHRLKIINESTGRVLATGNNEEKLRPIILRLQKKYRYLKMLKDNSITLLSIGNNF